MISKQAALANWEKHIAPSQPFSKVAMRARVARFKNLPASPRAFADTKIPGHARVLKSVLGKSVTDNPHFMPAIAAAEHFNIDYIEASTGNGAALHWHDTEEVFVAITGKWRVRWGDRGENSVILAKGDVISVPPYVHRSFENLSRGRQRLMAILGGRNPPKVKWSPVVAERGRKAGVGFDDDGNAIYFGANGGGKMGKVTAPGKRRRAKPARKVGKR